MGCDIHIVLERKHNDQWVGLYHMTYLPARALEVNYGKDACNSAKFKIKERDYEFFWQLAGVRGGDGPEGVAKGSPDDASLLSKLIFDDDTDLHSHSWTTFAELIPVLARTKYAAPAFDFTADLVAAKLGDGKSMTEKIINEWLTSSFEDDEGYSAKNFDDWRIVFAFDN